MQVSTETKRRDVLILCGGSGSFNKKKKKKTIVQVLAFTLKIYFKPKHSPIVRSSVNNNLLH